MVWKWSKRSKVPLRVYSSQLLLCSSTILLFLYILLLQIIMLNTKKADSQYKPTFWYWWFNFRVLWIWTLTSGLGVMDLHLLKTLSGSGSTGLWKVTGVGSSWVFRFSRSEAWKLSSNARFRTIFRLKILNNFRFHVLLCSVQVLDFQIFWVWVNSSARVMFSGLFQESANLSMLMIGAKRNHCHLVVATRTQVKRKMAGS